MITLQYVAVVSFGASFLMFVVAYEEIVPSFICAAIICGVCTGIASLVI